MTLTIVESLTYYSMFIGNYSWCLIRINYFSFMKIGRLHKKHMRIEDYLSTQIH